MIRYKYKRMAEEKLQNARVNEREGVETVWEIIKNSVRESAKETCGIVNKRKVRGDPWWDEDIRHLVKEKNKIWRSMIEVKNRDGRLYEKIKIEYKVCKRRVKKEVRKKKKEHERNESLKVSKNFRDNIKMFWKYVKESRSSCTPNGIKGIADKEGRMLVNMRDVCERWRDHFSEMYGSLGLSRQQLKHATPNKSSIKDISKEEVERAIKRLKNGKAAGVDGVTGEMLKYGGPAVLQAMTHLCNECWRSGFVPKDWTRAVIVPLYKGKGAQKECKSYRAISLLSVASKVYGRILVDRVNEKTDKMLWDVQAGFRQGRGCTDQVFTLRSIINKHLDKDKKVYCAFMDLEKAYDRVVREELWKVLSVYGLDEQLIQGVKSLYCESKACVRVGEELTDWFDISMGVRQGCVMSPSLFNLYIDSCVKKLADDECGIRMDSTIVTCLMYADDAVLLASDDIQLQSLVTRMSEVCLEKHLRMNADKCKVMVVEKNECITKCEIKLDSVALEQVNEFLYLGSLISRNGKTEDDMKRRVNMADRMNGALMNVIRNKNISKKARVAVHNGVLVPTIMYGSESWIMQKKDESKLNAVEMRSLRNICRKSLRDRIKNEDIRRECDVEESVIVKIKKGMLRWFGHVERMNDERLTKMVYVEEVRGKRKRGRPRKSWANQIEEYLKDGNVRSHKNKRACMRGCMRMNEAKEICQNRVVWRSIVAAYPA